ncbi:MAG: hypothetical protein BWY78_00409 [Alphaproteobacteria bacterium ADurb.Bin438]|nr:MAG: hypothetical protein BWY78_00409 [Alphaproteobacteria bacterium ADurb.Bin438]
MDIDFHVYSDEFNIKKSITSISKIAFHKDVIKFTYKNLIDTEEECFEWHFFVKHKGEIWQIDIIHIKKNSLFDGLFEKVTDKIIKILNHKTRLAILKIKYDATFKIPGVFIYKAVINDNIENYQDFLKWYEINKNDNLLNWTP